MQTLILKTANIFEDNPIFFPPEFSRIASARSVSVPAVSFVTRRETLNQKFLELIDGSLPILAETLSDNAEIVLFCAQAHFVENTAIARHRGLWQSNELLNRVISAAHKKGPERNVVVGQRIRFYGLCSTRVREAGFALEAIRSIRSSFGLLDKNLDVSAQAVADDLYRSAFRDPEKTENIWPMLIPNLVREHRVLVRVFGGFDDRELAIDLFNFSKTK